MESVGSRASRLRKAAWLVPAVAPVVASILSAGTAQAANDTWSGADSVNWSDPLNWTAGAAPVSGDALIFAGTTPHDSTNNDLLNLSVLGFTFNAGADPYTLGGNGVTLLAPIPANANLASDTGTTTGGTISNASANTQTISLPLTLAAGKHVISTTSTGGLDLSGALTRNTGAIVQFNRGAGLINLSGTGLSNDASGILGGWAVTSIGNNTADWATLDGSGNVVAYTGYTSVAPGGTIASNTNSNVKIASSGTNVTLAATGTTDINTLENAGTTAAQTVDVGAGNTLRFGANGAILQAAGSSGSANKAFNVGVAGTAGTITAGGGTIANNPGELTLYNNNFAGTNNDLNINSVIADNGTGQVSVNIVGYVVLSGVNTYTGGTIVQQGRAEFNSTQNSFGPNGSNVTVLPGAQVFFNNADATAPSSYNWTLSGVGSTESNGLGAIRFKGNTLAGTVTLAGTTALGMGNAAGGNITASISGPGGLIIGHGNNANGSGLLTVGDGTGTQAYTYQGDTVVDENTAGASTLKINAGSNNLLPHGAGTGNFFVFGQNTTGTGLGTFDLNGTSQTINALGSGGAAPANAQVISSGGTGTLTLGDNNASGSWVGNIGGGAAGSQSVNVVKIGSGTETFTGINQYTGSTTVQNGTLAVIGSGTVQGTTGITLDTSTGGTPTFVSNTNIGKALTMGTTGTGTAQLAPGASAATGSIGTMTLSNLTVNGGNLLFDLATPGASDLVAVTGALSLAGASNAMDIIPAGGQGGSAYTILTAGSISGNLPTLIQPTTSRLSYSYDAASWSPTHPASSIIIDVNGAVANLTWTGVNLSSGVANWDVNATQNWFNTGSSAADVFFNGDNVTFDNTGSNTSLVNIPSGTTVARGSMTVNNDAGHPYAISGAGSIGGTGALTKSGVGSLTLATNNSYSGGTILNAGTLNINNAGGIGGGTLTLGGGALDNTSGAPITVSTNNPVNVAADVSFTGNNNLNLGTGAVTLNANPNITVAAGNLTVGGVIGNGTGSNITKAGAGTLTLSGSNTFTGTTNINAGSVVMGNAAAFGPTSAANGAVTVASGATLDLSGIGAAVAAPGFGPKVFNIAGNGVGNLGAIVNNNPTGVNFFLHGLNNVNLTADASMGGTNPQWPTSPNSGIGRIDIGRDGTGDVLGLNGHTLTWVGSNYLNLATNLTVGAGNIVFNNGTLSLDTGIHDQHPTDGNIIMNAGTDLQFFTVPAGNVTTPIILNGSNIQMGQAQNNNASSIDSNYFLNGNVTVSPQNGATSATSQLTLTGVISDVTSAESSALAANPSLPAVPVGSGGITKTGAGILVLSGANTYSGGTTVSAGTLTVAGNGALPTGGAVVNNATLLVNANSTPGQVTGTGTLTIGTAAGPNSNVLALASGSGQSTQSALTVNTGSTLDLTNNSFDIHYGAGTSPDAAVRGYLISGYDGGTWNGTGVTSSTAAADIVHHAVGYADGADNIVPGLASGDELIKYTFAGDANLDGKVDVSDLGILATNYGHLTGQRWDQGDFTYDGGVDVSDLGVLATNYGAGTGVTGAAAAAMFQSDLKLVEAEDPAFAAAIGAVPEPASLGLLAIGSLAMLGRRRRRAAN